MPLTRSPRHAGQALVEHSGEVFAIDATCYHMGGPLLHADIEDLAGFGPAIVCPWHRYQISLRSGDGLYVNMARQTCSKGARQRVHAVERREGQIYVRVSQAEGDGPEAKVESDTYAFNKPAPSGGHQHAPPGRSGQVLSKGRPGAAGVRGAPPRAFSDSCAPDGCAGAHVSEGVAVDVANSMRGADGRAPWARGPDVGSAPKAGGLGAKLGSFRMPSFLRGGAGAGAPEGWASAVVVATRPVGRATVQLSLRGKLPGADASVWERGAHLSVRLTPTGAERPYTPYMLPSKAGQFELVVKAYPRGALSPGLAALRVGSELLMHGPLSGSAGVRAGTTALVLIAGGTGITPLLQLLLPLVARASAGGAPLLPVHLLCFNRCEADALLRAELDELARSQACARAGMRVLHCLTEPPAGWAGLSGRPSAELLGGAVPGLAGEGVQVFYCGPQPFNDAVRSVLAKLGCPDSAAHEFA